MIPANAHILKRAAHKSKGVTYDVSAYVDPAQPNSIRVEASSGGQDVLVSYPDGLKAHLVYVVDFTTAIDLAVTKNIDAAEELIATAKGDIDRLI
jgi:hypothetical protein